MLVKGKPRTRGLPAATPVPADKGKPAKDDALGVGGAEEAAADLFKPKVARLTNDLMTHDLLSMKGLASIDCFLISLHCSMSYCQVTQSGVEQLILSLVRA